MTPKEKATELLGKMNNKPITTEEWMKCSDYVKKDLKRKVLVAVEELIYAFRQFAIDNQFYYWQEVKSEIEKL